MVQAWVMLARIQLAGGNRSQALATLKKAQASNPAHAGLQQAVAELE